VRDHGAAGDGQTLDTAAVQKAIDHFGVSGGLVRVPKGDYRVGTLELRSNMTLRLEEGATLVGSKDLSDYVDYVKREAETGEAHFVANTGSSQVMLHGFNLENVRIEGKGVIDGNRVMRPNLQRGPLSILFEHSRDVTIEGITVTRSPAGQSRSSTAWKSRC
jgi:polygalacturonase